jgi:hypothetical protein
MPSMVIFVVLPAADLGREYVHWPQVGLFPGPAR